MKKLSSIKNAYPVVVLFMSLITFIFSGYVYIDSVYARVLTLDDMDKKHDKRTSKIEHRIDNIELRLIYREALDNKYTYRSLLWKYPDDEELKEELEKAEDEVDFIKKQLDNQKRNGAKNE